MSTKKLQILDSLIKNADTLDGKHADEFAAASDVETLKTKVDNIQDNAYDDTAVKNLISANTSDIAALEGLVGDTKVATQIDNAIDAIDYPVDSVNGKTGAVVLSASDVGALPADTAIPSIAGLATETYVDGKIEAVNTELDTKVDKVSGKGLSTNDYTTTEKNKLAGIASGANKTVVDSALSSSSTNPVQNKVVNEAISSLNTLVGDEPVSDQITTAIANKSDVGHTHDDRYYTESEIDSKLSGKSDTGHTHSAYVNQNAFSKVTVGSTTIEADNATDTLTLAAGNNITLTPDASGDKVTIAATDTVYTHPSSGVTAGTYKSVTVNTQGHVTSGSNPTTLSGYGITDAAAKSHSHNAATTSAAGFMSKNDKVALDKVVSLVGDTSVAEQIEDAIESKSDVSHTHTAAQVGADPSGSAESALTSAKSYTDTQISNLINGAPTTLDTLGEIATAMEENADVVAALEESIGTRASASDLTAHTGNKSNPHGVTLSQLGVTATAAELNYVDGVTSKVQTQLNAKVPTSRTVNGKALSANITLSASDVGADASGAANTALTNAKAYTDAEITEWVGDAPVAEQIATAIASKSDSSHTHDDRYYTESEINTKLSGKSDTSHTHSAYVNQNAFSNVVVGSTTITADSATDTLTLAAGSNITLTPDASGDKVTIAAKDTVYTHPTSGVTAGTYKSVTVNAQGHVTGGSNPTTLSGYGITDAATKTELNAVSTLVGDKNVSEQISEAFDGAITGLSISGKTITYTKGDGTSDTLTTQDTNTVYTHPTTSGNKHIPSGGSSGQILRWSADGTAAWGADNNTTYSAATQSAQGLMSAADKTKLDGIATGANKITVDSALSSTSTNPVQNKAVNTAISNLNTLVGDKKVSEQINTAIAAKAPTSHASTATTYGVSSASNYGHAMASSTTPKANGTAAVGSETAKFARGDHVHPLQTTVSGNAGTATKLAAAKTIALSDGAIGTATAFDGSANISIPVTSVKEAYLTWGGKNINGGVSPVGAALSAEHSANRLAYLNPNALNYEYSDDGGSTWTTMSVSDTTKIGFVTTSGTVYVGNASTVTTNHRTRITLAAQDGTNSYVYTRPRKLLLNVSTYGHGLTVTIEIKTGVSGASWTTVGEYPLSGWSGWNDIPLNLATLGGGKSQTTNNWYLRLTFATTSVNSSYTTTKTSIIGMRLFGDACWTGTSNMGETGHLYSYDTSQNATFPAKVTATGGFSGSLSGNATSATKATQDASGNVITSTYATKSELNTVSGLVGDTAVSEQISEAIDGVTLSSLGVTATAAELNKLDGVTATTTELNYVDGVTSNIQTQLNAKAASGHTHSSYVNQNAFSNVKVGSTTVAADTTTDTLTLAGSNVTITPDATNDKVTIGITKDNVVAALGYTPPTTNTTYSAAGSSLGLVKSGGDVTISSGVITVNDDSHNHTVANIDGLQATLDLIGDASVSEQISDAFDGAITGLSVSGKTITYTKGDGTTGTITTQDTNTTYSAMTGATSSAAGQAGLVPAPAAGKQASFLRGDGTWVVPTNTTYSAATTSAAGLMSAADKTKLNGIATGANKTTVDSALSSTSTNPVQNKVVNTAISNLNTLVGDKAVSEQIESATSALVKTVNGTSPDANGNVSVQAGVTSVNGETGAVTINRESLLMIASETAPASPTTGMIWFDIS